VYTWPWCSAQGVDVGRTVAEGTALGVGVPARVGEAVATGGSVAPGAADVTAGAAVLAAGWAVRLVAAAEVQPASASAHSAQSRDRRMARHYTVLVRSLNEARPSRFDADQLVLRNEQFAPLRTGPVWPRGVIRPAEGGAVA
jgi:hypothetical protein